MGGFALSVLRRSDGTRRLILWIFPNFFPVFFPFTRRDLYEYLAQILCFLHLYEHVQHSSKKASYLRSATMDIFLFGYGKNSFIRYLALEFL